MKVKICGITNLQDAIWMANFGVDFLGFNFYKQSKRKISPQLAKQVIEKLPSYISPVGIFVNEELETVLKIVKKCKLTFVQLHGEESEEYCQKLKEGKEKFNFQIIKAFKIKDEESLSPIPAFQELVDYYLLDTYLPGREGGTGETFNWDLALEVKKLGKPIFLAGGLTVGNIIEAVSKVEPFAVDVASGVEKSPRRKDYEKVKQFIINVRMAEKRKK